MWPKGTAYCVAKRKLRYPTYVEAANRLKVLQRQRGRPERGIHPCPDCLGWHLTSQERKLNPARQLAMAWHCRMIGPHERKQAKG